MRTTIAPGDLSRHFTDGLFKVDHCLGEGELREHDELALGEQVTRGRAASKSLEKGSSRSGDQPTRIKRAERPESAWRGTCLAVHEAEIDQIVYRLFDLTQRFF